MKTSVVSISWENFLSSPQQHTGAISVVVKVTPKKKTRRRRKPLIPSVKDFRRLCGCFKIQHGESALCIATENLFFKHQIKKVSLVLSL